MFDPLPPKHLNNILSIYKKKKSTSCVKPYEMHSFSSKYKARVLQL